MTRRLSNPIGATLLTVFTLLPGLANAYAGRIIFAYGEANIRAADGTPRPARIGATVDTGDAVVTRDGRVQLRFTDGGSVALIPHSEFRVDAYQYAGDGNETGLFSLVKGGLRAITGAIGKKNRDAYRLNAVVATIGIRGTSYQARYCEGDCAQSDGLYVQGGEGTIYVANAAGSLDLSRGQAAYVAAADAQPVETTVQPEVPATGGDAEIAAVLPSGEVGEFDTGLVAFQDQVAVTRTVNVTGGGGAVAATDIPEGAITVAFRDEQVTGADNGFFQGGAGGGAERLFDTTDVPDGLTVGFDENNGVTLMSLNFTDDDGTGSVALTFSNVADAGSAGDLYWGRWTNGEINATGADTDGTGGTGSVTLSQNESVHYILSASPATIPGAGEAYYDFVGGTPSTGDDGTLGKGVTGGRITADFGGRAADLNMTVVHGSTYAVEANLEIDDHGSLNGSAHCGSGGASCADANVAGFLSGQGPNAPPSAGVSYEIDRDPMNDRDEITGVAGFACTMGC